MKLRAVGLLGTVLLAMQPLAASAQEESFQEWMAKAAEARSQALDAIEAHVIRSGFGPSLTLWPEGSAGPCVVSICQGFKTEFVNTPQGGMLASRALSPMELGVLAGNTSSRFLMGMGNGMMLAQIGINGIFGGSTDPATLEYQVREGADVATNDGDILAIILNPSLMFAAGSVMMTDTAIAAGQAEESLRDSAALAQAETNAQYSLLTQLDYAGTVPFDGITAVSYEAPNLALPAQDVNGEQFTLTSASIVVDPDRYRFLKQRLQGTATMEGETREFFIEVEYSDFRNPPGCGTMEEPYRRVMRMGGMLDAEQMAQMEQARAQLAEFEQQLETMPAQQRAMLEQMMGSQMAMMRGLVNNGALERVEEVEEILCNPDFAALFDISESPPEDDEALLRRIQEYLVILGYEPGNIEGELDTLTGIAISQFQAEQNLPVTGEPSAELADLLASLVEP